MNIYGLFLEFLGVKSCRVTVSVSQESSPELVGRPGRLCALLLAAQKI